MKIIPISIKNQKAKYFDAIVKPTEYYVPGVQQKVLYCICPIDNVDGIVAQTNSGLLQNYEVIDNFPPSDKACIVCGGEFYRDLEGNVIFLANDDYYVIHVSNGTANIKAKVNGVTLTKENIASNVSCISAVYGWQTLDPATSDTNLGLCIAYATPSGTFLLRLNQYTLEGVQTIQLNTKGLVTGVDITLTDDYRIAIVASYPGGSVLHVSDRYWVGGAVSPETIVGRFRDKSIEQILTQFMNPPTGDETIKGRFGEKSAALTNNQVIRSLFAYNDGLNVSIFFDGTIDVAKIDIAGIEIADADGVIFAPSIEESQEHMIVVNCEGINNFTDFVTVTYKGTGLVTPLGTAHTNVCSYKFTPVGLIPDDFPPPICLGACIAPGGNNGTEVFLLFDRKIRNKTFSTDDLNALTMQWSEYKHTVGQSEHVGINGESIIAETTSKTIEVLSNDSLPAGHSLPTESCIDATHTVLKVTTTDTFRNGTNGTNMTISYNSLLGHLMGTKPVADFSTTALMTELIPHPRIHEEETLFKVTGVTTSVSIQNTVYSDLANPDNPYIAGRFQGVSVTIENTGQIVP